MASTSEFNWTYNNDTSPNKRASSLVNSINIVKIFRTLSLDTNESINVSFTEDTNYRNNYDIVFYTDRMLSNENNIVRAASLKW